MRAFLSWANASTEMKPNLPQSLLRLIANANGVQAALRKYSEIKTASLSEYELRDDSLTHLGYELLECARTNDAIRVFKRDILEHQKSWKAYNALVDAYQHAGKTDLAIHYYEMSVELNPSNENGIDMLRKLKRKTRSRSCNIPLP